MQEWAMNKRRSNGNDWWPVSAFQANPSWYEHYWYTEVRPKAPSRVRRLLAMVASWGHNVVQRLGEARIDAGGALHNPGRALTNFDVRWPAAAAPNRTLREV
jgi:hypothetical protein